MANAWIDETLPKLASSLTTQHSFKSQFSALTTNADRVQFCLADREVQVWVGLFFMNFSFNRNGLKCSITAGKFREKGNDHFQEHKFESAIQLYSRAICFAPQIVEETASELAFAYGDRSAAYFEIGQYDNALNDINAALGVGYGQFESVTKLQLRKCDCLIRLGRASEAKEFFIQKPTNDEDDTKRWNELFGRISLNEKKMDPTTKVSDVSLIEKLTNEGLFKSNEKMSSFSAKVAVQYDEVKGRHLVAQEDIQFGDILAVSQSYVSLLDSKKDVLKHCHHCCRDISLESVPIRPIPCTDCSSVVYCSDECRTESVNSYHRYECGQTDLLVQLPKFARMSLRLLYSAGMDQIRSVVNSPEDANHISEQPNDHYSHVYQLVHHSDGRLKNLKILYEEMLKSSILTCLLLPLATNGNFPMKPKEDEKLVGGILLRHLHQLRFNTLLYSPLNKKKEVDELRPSQILFDLYPLYASTLNHSCGANANARLESAPKHQSVCLLQATQPISAGTEITIPYLEKGYLRNTFLEMLFKDRYLFTCSCARCTYYVRNTPFGLTNYLGLGCSDCGHLMELSSEHRSKSEVFRCTNCRLTMNNAEMIRRCHLVDQLRSSFFQLHRSGEKRVRKLKDIVEQLETLLNRDSGILCIFHTTLADCYLSNGQMDKAWACLEQYLSIYGHTFGEESLALLNAFDLVKETAFGQVVNPMTNLMKVFEQQHSELYQRYLARMEQWKQLKLKYYKDY